jgi:hypothetical protein
MAKRKLPPAYGDLFRHLCSTEIKNDAANAVGLSEIGIYSRCGSVGSGWTLVGSGLVVASIASRCRVNAHFASVAVF